MPRVPNSSPAAPPPHPALSRGASRRIPQSFASRAARARPRAIGPADTSESWAIYEVTKRDSWQFGTPGRDLSSLIGERRKVLARGTSRRGLTPTIFGHVTLDVSSASASEAASRIKGSCKPHQSTFPISVGRNRCQRGRRRYRCDNEDASFRRSLANGIALSRSPFA